MGARAFGGATIPMPDDPTNFQACDHGFTEWFIPPGKRKHPMVLVHGSSTRSYQTTFDGQPGFQSIFLRDNYPVYLVDLPWTGRAGKACSQYTWNPIDFVFAARLVFNNRVGLWASNTPFSEAELFPGVAFSSDPKVLDQYFRNQYEEINTPTNTELESNALAVLLQEVYEENGRGPILHTHSSSSSRGLNAAMKTRMGWDEYFTRQGFDTYLADQVSRARSGFDATEYLKVRNGVPGAINPNILVLNDQSSWNAFRWGTTSCTASPCQNTTTPNPGIRFPMNTVGVGPGSTLTFYNQVIPDLLATLDLATSINCVDGPCRPPVPSAPFNTPIAMAKLATQLGGAILVGHSESSPYPTNAALQAESGCKPWTSASACKVKGIIQIETGCYANLTPDDIDTLKHIPILLVYGDYAPSPRPESSCVTEMNQITAAGGDIKYAWLPALTPGSLYPGSPGPIFGNEHMMMLDNNNQQIADILIGWATSRGL